MIFSNTAKLHRLWALLFIGCAAFVGCNVESSPEKQKATEPPPANGKPDRKIIASLEAKATLTLGDEVYAFDWVMCAPGPSNSTMVVASDQAKRSEFPMVRATIFADQPVGSVANTMSADFTNAKPRILWLRESGTIDETDGGLIASGTLKGSEMVKLPTGNTKPVPLGESGVREFKFEAKCKLAK